MDNLHHDVLEEFAALSYLRPAFGFDPDSSQSGGFVRVGRGLKTCDRCASALPAWKKRFCGPKCSVAYHYARRHSTDLRPRAVACLVCSKSLASNDRGQRKKFCSSKCRTRAFVARRGVKRD